MNTSDRLYDDTLVTIKLLLAIRRDTTSGPDYAWKYVAHAIEHLETQANAYLRGKDLA